VLLGARRVHDQIRIEVWDTGIGIHADHQEMIFEEFQQLGNPGRDRGKGLGLGLAIVRRLAGLMDHTINVRSNINQGSVFQIYLPRAAAQPHVQRPSNVIPGDHLRGSRVLLIDDEQEIRQGFTVLLKQWGCIVESANGIVDALEIVKQAAKLPDIIVADYRLQDDTTGLQAIDQIHLQVACSIPAIIVTGDTAAQRLQEAKAGRYPLLHKPVQPAKLRTLLNTELLKARAEKNIN
jgi:CheY-like chemotaxis protein